MRSTPNRFVDRRSRLLLLGMLTVAAALAPAHAGGDVNFFLGGKQMDEDVKPVDEHGEGGVQMTFDGKNWPVGIAVDLLGSRDETRGLRFEVGELAIGPRKIWGRQKSMRPFVGGGIVFVSGEFEFLDVPIDDGDGAGLWIDGGVFWRIGKHFNIGFDARISRAEIEIGGQDIQVGGDHFGLLLGFGWGE